MFRYSSVDLMECRKGEEKLGRHLQAINMYPLEYTQHIKKEQQNRTRQVCAS